MKTKEKNNQEERVKIKLEKLIAEESEQKDNQQVLLLEEPQKIAEEPKAIEKAKNKRTTKRNRPK